MYRTILCGRILSFLKAALPVVYVLSAIIILGVGIVLVGVVVVQDNYNQEIQLHSYDEINRFVSEFPELREEVDDAMQDDEISRGEHAEISNIYKSKRKNRMFGERK